MMYCCDNYAIDLLLAVLLRKERALEGHQVKIPRRSVAFFAANQLLRLRKNSHITILVW